MQTVKKKRTYPTLAQKAKMIAVLDSDKLLQRGKFSSGFTKREAERRWRSLADSLNAIPGAKKGWMEWRKTWQDMKATAKKKHNAARQATSLTLEGPTVPCMTQEDLNVLETMAMMLVRSSDGFNSITEYAETEKEVEKRLINLVRQQKCLWYPDDPNYSNKRLKDALWLAIARHLPTPDGSVMTSDATQRKWKCLKDARGASLRKLRERSGPPCKTYKYAELMSFLDDIDDYHEQYIELVIEEESPPADPLEHMFEVQVSSSPVEAEDCKPPPALPPAERARLARCTQRLEDERAALRHGVQRYRDIALNCHPDSQKDSDSSEVNLQELRRKPDDHHTQFCLSLAPIMRSLPLEKVIDVRIKVLQLISEAMHGNSNE